ncbi:hypothetical protein, partial [Chryseobacterium gambrini]|uniref:hypothetical protein n=1 Tax=Chryseobacterium gambrini TaxID=373672 RepID=UPI003BA68827
MLFAVFFTILLFQRTRNPQNIFNEKSKTTLFLLHLHTQTLKHSHAPTLQLPNFKTLQLNQELIALSALAISLVSGGARRAPPKEKIAKKKMSSRGGWM